jgi:choline dehydrogenase-like flavoprotein
MQMLQYPYSRGSIHINPSNPLGKPIIDLFYFEGEGGDIDFDVIVKAHEFGDKIHQTLPMSDIVVKRVFPPLPADGQKTDWISYVRDTAITDWHPVGTFSMLPRDKGGVVNSNLIVHGTRNLRVVDASIMPLHVGVHI